MARLIKKKIINAILNKNNKKFLSENLFKLNLKNLNKQNKKQFKKIIYLVINYSLPVFELIKKLVKIKKTKIIKFKPFFILKNKTRIFLSLKLIVNFYKKIKINTNYKTLFNNFYKLQNNEQIVNFKNVLTFYKF